MNRAHEMKMAVRESAGAGRKRRRPSGLAACCASLGLILASGLAAAAQEMDDAIQTNDVVAAEVLARLNEVVQAVDSAQLEELAAAGGLNLSNGLAQALGPGAQEGSRSERMGHLDSSNRAQGPSRSPGDDRRSRGRRSSRSKSDQGGGSRPASDYSRSGGRTEASAAEGTNASLSRLDYSAFRMIADRNIFDPNRYPRRPGEPRVRSAPRAVDSLTLVGTMSYEKGTFAFFDGSSSDYKKALKLSDAIAGYRVTNIAPNGVRLAVGTNELEMRVGMQLHREEDGPWRLSGAGGSYAALPATTSTNAVAATATTSSGPATGATESDIIKRLMQRREQE